MERFDKIELAQVVSNLDAWLDTWKDKEGGIHGYVVHHHADALRVIAPDTWTQSAAILGHINLYTKTKDKKWLKKAIVEAEYLVKNYVWEQNYFCNSMFEHKPGSGTVYTSIIHNAYPSYALIKLCKILKTEKKKHKKFLNVAKDNVYNYLIKKNWDEKRGVFAREDGVFILNMASIALRALVYLDELENKKNRLIEKYCIPTADNIIKLQKENGCFPYNSAARDNVAPLIYVGITLGGLITLYKRTEDSRYLQACRSAARFLLKNIDSETGLFYHRYEGDRLKKYPEFVAGSMLIAHQLKRLEELGEEIQEINRILKAVKKMQFKNGGIQQFVGFSDIFMPEYYPAEPYKKKWRDVLPIPGWNALAFEGLTYCLKGKKLPPPKIKFPCQYPAEEFNIIEEQKSVRFVKEKEVIAKWAKLKDVWVFGKLNERPGSNRILYQLYVWKKRLFFIRPLLNLMHPFRICEPKKVKQQG